MNPKTFPAPLMIAALLLAPANGRASAEAPASRPSRPNVVLILADDLGYGDVQCYNAERSKIPTPRIDRPASQGMSFTIWFVLKLVPETKGRSLEEIEKMWIK